MPRLREKRTENLRVFVTPTTKRRAELLCEGSIVPLSALMNQLLVEHLDALNVADPDPQPFVPADRRGRK